MCANIQAPRPTRTGLSNVGNSGFSLAARGSYMLRPDNNLDPGSAAGSPPASALLSQPGGIGGYQLPELWGRLVAYGRWSWKE